MLLELCFTWLSDLHGDELEAFSLESGDDGTDEASLDTVWLDHDVGALISPINIMLKEIKPTFIKMGEPLCQLIPIKRETVVARTGDLSKNKC